MSNYMTFRKKSRFSITKLSYIFSQSPKLYDFYKKNLPRSPFAFIFIVRKLKNQAVFKE